MGSVFWGLRHARASSRRAANLVSKSAETSADRAFSVSKMADHHSAGILSLCHHLETALAPTPMSTAMASREGQSSMIERNDVKSAMPALIGQTVLKRKAIPSLDSGLPLGQDVPMAKSSKKPLSDYELGFLARTWASREAKGWTQELMGEKLGGLSQDFYKQYETRSMLPRHLTGPFVELTGISFEYLFDGKVEGPAWRQRFSELASKQKPAKKGKKTG